MNPCGTHTTPFNHRVCNHILFWSKLYVDFHKSPIHFHTQGPISHNNIFLQNIISHIVLNDSVFWENFHSKNYIQLHCTYWFCVAHAIHRWSTYISLESLGDHQRRRHTRITKEVTEAILINNAHPFQCHTRSHIYKLGWLHTRFLCQFMWPA